MVSTMLPLRKDVPMEFTWDLNSIFKTPKDWEMACDYLQNEIPAMSAFQGKFNQGPKVLLQYFEKWQELNILMGKISVYAFDDYAVDTSNQNAAARAGQSASLRAKFAAACAFSEPELMTLGFDTLENWLVQEPKLKIFTYYFSHLQKQQKHVRSGEVEEVLAMAGDPFSGSFGTFNALTGADMKFKDAVSSAGEKLEVGQASAGSLVTNNDREIRRTAWQNYADGYLGLKNTFASVLTSAVKQDVFRARVRKYESSLEASLLSNDIPVSVFTNLMVVFQKHLPTWHRYWQIRKRILGYDTFHVYDIKAPLTSYKPYVPFEQAVEWISSGLAPLGEEYVSILRRGCLQERWVDRACNKGKRDGAFSSGSYGTNPFIMMSYADDLFSMSTLAHELGHSMHSYYSRREQPYIYSGYGLFVAEVASNFNQAMVRNYLLNANPEKNFQIALIEEAMSNFHRYFFIMPTLARFELEMHTRVEQGRPVSADILIGLMADLFHEGYGDEVDFDRERIGITWAQFLHMYMNFYVYQYATGISGAQALSLNVINKKPGAAENYLQFLKTGGSMDPLDALRLAGVDLEMTEPIEAAFGMLDNLVNRLDNLV